MTKSLSRLAVIGAGAAALVIAGGPAGAKVEGDTIIFGAALSLTGKYSTAGQHARRGYDLAIKKINAAGGVFVAGRTYKIAVKYYDDESTPARGAQLTERLIVQDGIKFMLGPYSSGLTKAVAPVIEKHKVPMIEANGAARSLFTKGYRYLFAVLSTADQYLSEAVNLVAEQAQSRGADPGSLRIALVFENDPFSQDVRLGVVDAARTFGMKIVIDDKLPPELNDMASSLNKVRALKPDLLVVSGHSKGAALAIRQMAQMKVKVPMLAMTHCESAKVTDTRKFGRNAENTLCATQWDENLNYRDPLFGSGLDYHKEFTQTYKYNPPYQAAESSAAVYVYAKALEKAGSFDVQRVRDAISGIEIDTFYGKIKFDDTGKNIAKPMVLRQIQDLKYVPVAPSKFATGKFRPTS